MEFKAIEGNDGAQMFCSGLGVVRFATYLDWRRGVEEMLEELRPHLLAAAFSLQWQTYYARRADAQDENHLQSSEAEIVLDQIGEILQRSPLQYTSFTLHLGEGMTSGHQMWNFEWSGIETDANGRPLAPADALTFDDFWPTDLPTPGGEIWRTAPHDAKAGRQAALDLWFGGSEANAQAFFGQIVDESNG